jgi:flavin-binding protein dodecin
MPDRCYKLVEIVGTSPNSLDEAIRNAIEKASSDVDHVDWFQVVETRGHVKDGKVAHFQVVVKVGYRLED